jgi:hypothetical protein
MGLDEKAASAEQQYLEIREAVSWEPAHQSAPTFYF